MYEETYEEVSLQEEQKQLGEWLSTRNTYARQLFAAIVYNDMSFYGKTLFYDDSARCVVNAMKCPRNTSEGKRIVTDDFIDEMKRICLSVHEKTFDTVLESETAVDDLSRAMRVCRDNYDALVAVALEVDMFATV